MDNYEKNKYLLKFYKDQRRLSVVVLSFFSAWMLSFAFQGQVLYALTQFFNKDPINLAFEAVAAHFAGLFLCGFFIKTAKAAKHLITASIVSCIVISGVFFVSPSILWNIALIIGSLLAGACVASWGYFFKLCTPTNERMKTAAEVLIYSNILMILLNITAIHLSPQLGLSLSILLLAVAAFFSVLLSEETESVKFDRQEKGEGNGSIHKPLLFLCLFIIIITINSGLMYQVVNPAFAHHQWLVSWYWALPYVIAIYVIKNLPQKTNRNYILYVAIAFMGLSFLAFMSFDRSVSSYLLINTLMLGACGVFDLFWWSILGEMLDLDSNPAKIFGFGLSANVLGVLLGGFIGNGIINMHKQNYNPSIIALVVVFIILIILPLLHKQLSLLLKNHTFLTLISEMPSTQQDIMTNSAVFTGLLTERESEIAYLLLKGKTYKMIAGELYLSENTIKTHIKNIYSKLNVNSRMELINLIMDRQIYRQDK